MAKAVSGRLIRLTRRIWLEKVRRQHPEFAGEIGYLEEVKHTITEPDYVVSGWLGEYLALKRCPSAPDGPKYLCVVYREAGNEGFVITMFFTSKHHELLRRRVVWSRLK